MSRSLASVLKTDSLKPLAQILRSKGRKGDTVLAHITPKEAAKLKREGGSGSINPDTGLPEFYDEYGGGFDFGFSPQTYEPVGSSIIYDQPAGPFFTGEMQGPSYEAPANFFNTPVSYEGIPGFESAAPPTIGQFTGFTGATSAPGTFGQTAFMTNATGAPPVTGADLNVIAGGAGSPGFDPRGTTEEGQKLLSDINKQASDQKTPAEKGFLDKLLSEKNLPLLALGGGGALLSALNSQQAQKQAAQSAEQIKAAYAAAAAEQRAGAQPLLQAGGTALSQALQGTLSPANQQAMQAAQAKAAQAAAGSGGVGAVQTAISEAYVRQRLLANQQSMALNLLGPANAQLAAAIQSELSGTTQGLQMRMNMSQQANQAAAGVYQSLATIMAAGLK